MWDGGPVLKWEPHTLYDIPIFEYRLNMNMLGSFEPAIPILNAINEIQSNRVDSVAQFVEIRRDWYHMKHKQVLALAEALDIPLKGPYDYLNNYEALSLLQVEGVKRVRSIVLGEER